MKEEDLNYIAALEKAIKKKYGDDAIQNPAKFWDETKEKSYLRQLKDFVEKQRKYEASSESENVKGVLVNIFGGIVRCDLIADGIIGAVEEVGIKVPVVVSLEGNNADLGAEKLASSGLNLIPAEGLTDAAQKIVTAVGAK